MTANRHDEMQTPGKVTTSVLVIYPGCVIAGGFGDLAAQGRSPSADSGLSPVRC